MLDELTDDHLFQSYIEGDDDAFKKLHDRYRNALWLEARRITGRAHAADDVVQETLATLYTKRHAYELGTSFGGWIFHLLRSHSVLWLRDRSILHTNLLDIEEPVLTDAFVGAEIEQQDFRERIIHQIEELLPSYRDLLFMYFFQGMTQKDMASVLNIPVATLKSRLHAAMKAFKSSWLLSHQDS